MRRLGKEIHDDHTDHDETDSDNGRQIQFLLEDKNRNCSREHDSQTCPDRIGHAERNALQGQGQKVETSQISDHHNGGRQPFGKAV